MTFGGTFDHAALESTLSNLKSKTVEEDFWKDAPSAQSILKKISVIENELSLWKKAGRKRDDIGVLLDLLAEENQSHDPSLIDEAAQELFQFQEMVDAIELRLTMGEAEDAGDAILTIHPGAGGTESQDWAEMLFRMYLMWIERQGFEYDIVDFQPGDEAGIKDVTVEVRGDCALGLLKAEAGVHRLVRISPFDASNRRHTSFASVFAYPAVTEKIDVEIQSDDLRIDTFRASGAGGQHVNKTDSAVRITHIPTGIVVQCQNERSQHKNKANALKILKSRLYQLAIEEQKESIQELESQKKDIGWGSQIRSYVFHPYTMVKDHRTNVEIGDGKKVLDGYLDPFIRAYLLQEASRRAKLTTRKMS